MREIYRKFGRSVRREGDVTLRVREAGEAIEEGGTFICAPIAEERQCPEPDERAVSQTADAIASIVKPPLALERMIISEGAALHEIGGVHWSDRARRVHLSIARPPYRALIDLADFTTAAIERICEALARIEGERQPRRVRLGAAVGAALLPSLLRKVPMQQSAASHDGKGAAILAMPAGEGTPANWFRPSYRARPVRAWFHLKADPIGELGDGVPEAIALLAPIHDRTLRVLCIDGGRAFAATIVVGEIAAVTPTNAWFPYAAGCFGAEMML